MNVRSLDPPAGSNQAGPTPSPGSAAPLRHGKLRRRLQRTLAAGLPALADRGRQELQRRIDRAALALRANRAASGGRPRAVRQDFHRRADLRLQNGLRFFAGAGEAFVPGYVSSRFPDARTRILARADAARAGRLQLMGYRLDFGDRDFDWHRDAVWGRSAPLLHWSRINPLDYEHVGDSKVTWELNRHQWLVELALAWRLSGDERYAASVAAAVKSWIRANPPGLGINWASSLEVSLRLIAWCWLLELLADAPSPDTSLRAEMRAWIAAHAKHVEKYLSRYFSPNTHLTGEALGLVYAGAVLADFPYARRWRQTGARILLRQLRRQVLSDGVYFEQATGYALYTADIYLHFFILAERNRLAVPESATTQLCRLLDYLVAIRRPDGSLPPIGDGDGGQLLPLAARAAGDCRGTLALAAALFSRPDYAWAADGPAPEVAWLLGRAGCDAFAALAPTPPAAPASQLFPEGGYAIMRGGWEGDAHQLTFDVGPLGGSLSGGHGHADLLSVQCATFGRARLVDPGTYCYTSAPQWRDHFRTSLAHNTVSVDGCSQAEPAGPFAWRTKPCARLRNWVSTPDFDFADAAHDAYTRLRDPVRHRRRALFVKPRYWILVDDLGGRGKHCVELSFQFEAAPLRVSRDGWAASTDAGGRGLFLRAFAAAGLAIRVAEGKTEPIAGWVSPNYGRRKPAPALVYVAETRLPLRIVTLLIPKEADMPAPKVTFADDRLALDFPAGQESIRFADELISVERPDRNDIVACSG